MIGALAGMPLLWLVPSLLWSLEAALKPGPPTDRERSAMAMSTLGLVVGAVLFGPPLGAGMGAAWVALRLGLPGVAGRWCAIAGTFTAGAVLGACLLNGGFGAQLMMALTPWRAGHLFWSLLMIGWGIWMLRRRR
jgi:hypothetical protein